MKLRGSRPTVTAVAGVLLPDLNIVRRHRIRRAAYRLVTCNPWPGDNATADDAAQLALYRALWLQRRTRGAAMLRRSDEAARMARSAIETYIVGSYCLHNESAVRELNEAGNRAAGRLTAYLAGDDLIPADALRDAVAALGPAARDLNIADVADMLEKKAGLTDARELYRAYYVSLSHLFDHASGQALMTHVGRNDKLTRRPAFYWSRRSAARTADACVGLLAAGLAAKAGTAPDLFIGYARDNRRRMITPVAAAASRAFFKSISVTQIPGLLRGILALRRYTHGAGLADDQAAREARIRTDFTGLLATVIPGVADGSYAAVIDELVEKILAGMDEG